MNCEETNLLFDLALERPDGAERRRVMLHLATCENCRHAFRGLAYVRAERHRPVPDPSPGAADRALEDATRPQSGRRGSPTSFWSGLATGAVAAGIGAVAAMLILADRRVDDGAPPEVAIALHEPRDVSIAIDSPEQLPDAVIHVSLRGAVDLLGFEGQRDVRWTTDLAQGVNELKLPVVATGTEGGQVRIVVQHGNRQKSFLIDVHVGEGRRAERYSPSNV
jgi:hypothetical protein